MNRFSTLLLTFALIIMVLAVPAVLADVPTPSCVSGGSVGAAAFSCPTPVPTETPTPVRAPSDTGKPGELSFNDSDLGVVLHQGTDANGNVTLEVFDIFNHTELGNLLFTVTQQDLAQFVNNPPAQNTLLYSVDNVAVYVLTTGEIQLNLGPDFEGKTHVKVFDAIPWSTVYSYVIEPAS